MRAPFLISAILAITVTTRVSAQCASVIQLGSATNIFTQSNNNTNPVAVDKDLGTVVFIHRQNANVFGGNSGNLRYDVSMNAGTTWTSNLGVLNPVSTWLGRYPNAVIHNPQGNTSPTAAYIGYFGTTVNGSGQWTGVVTGVRQLSGSGNTESYNQPSAAGYYVSVSMVKGAPGVYWALDRVSNGTTPTGDISVFRGIFNPGNNDISWSTVTTLYPSYNQSYYGSPVVSGMKIAFDPSGTVGWICLMTHLSSGPSSYGYYPVFYSTSNGGMSWSGPIAVNMNQLSCIGNNTSGYTAVSEGEAGLVVDAQGRPHLFTRVGVTTNNYEINHYGWNRLFDITQVNNQWKAEPVAAVQGSINAFYGSVSTAYHFLSLQASRSVDGNKLFFSWTSNSGYTPGMLNASPNLFARAFDVQQGKWTPVKDFTSCNPSVNGKIFYPHLAENVLEPSSGVYKLAPVYAEFSVPGDPDQPVNFNFLDNCTFSASEFTMDPPSSSISILQGSLALKCTGTPLYLQLSGSYSQITWSGGGPNNTGTAYEAPSPGIYSVTAYNGCTMASATVAVSLLTVSAAGTATLCAGQSATIGASTNSSTYTWTPGNFTLASVSVTPAVTTSYTVNVSGYNCQMSAMHTVSVAPLPAINIVAPAGPVCAGDQVVLQGSGGSSYLWSSGSSVSTTTVFPSATAVYTLTALSTESCQATKSHTVEVKDCTALPQYPDAEFTVFPNPAQDRVHIVTGGPAHVVLFNQLGQEAASFTVDSAGEHALSVREMPAGVYYAAVSVNGQTRAVKFVVE
jgi:hypothetical protein